MQVIADRAGVSRALVSMALRNSPKVAPETRARIQALAKELNYRPNPMVRALMTEVRTRKRRPYLGTVAFITNLCSADYWKSLHTYPDYFRGALERGEQLGYKVEHFWLGEYADHPERLVQILHSRGITGLIIAPLSTRDPSFGMEIREFSAVTFGYFLEHPTITRVTNHHLKTMQEAVRQLKMCGYRKIGFVIQVHAIPQVSYLWIAGIEIARRLNPDMELLPIPQEEYHEKGFRNWFRTNRPEAIVAVNLEVWGWIRELGLSIPDELGFMHLNCRLGDTFSGMYLKTYQMGATAMEVLANYMERNLLVEEVEPQVIMFYSRFNPGTTIRLDRRVDL